MLLRSPRPMSPAAVSASGDFVTGTLSPVRAASSARRLALSSTRASAGTASPASSTSTSPATSSSLGTVTSFPPRRTRLCAALSSFRAAMACSALLSWYTPSTALMMTTMRMMMTSAKLSCAYALVMAEISAAASSTRIIGSASCWKKRFTSDGFGGSVSTLRPSRARRAAACSGVRPSGVLSSACRVSDGGCR